MANVSGKTANARQKQPRTASKEERRQQLIDATIKSIRKYGIAGTTMTTITKIAGLSTGLVNFHFKTKEILFQETLRFLAIEHHEQWKMSYEQAELAPEAKLMAIVAAHFHPRICSRKKIAVWFGFFGEAGSRASYRRLVNEIDQERRMLSTDLCQQLVADGNYKNVDPEDITYTLEGLYDGFWLNMLMYPGEFTRFDALKRIQVYLARVFPDHFDRPDPT